LGLDQYGCGTSTLWWAERVSDLVVCEHDRDWFDRIKRDAPCNVTMIYKELVYGGEYSEAILGFKDCFDIVVIDGRDRVRCAKNALKALKEDGVIIWDNTERNKYQEGFDYLKAEGFKRIDFWGTGPVGIAKWCTTVFYRRNNCLEI
jgi:predicted O-methyltransferase YrrM